MTEFLKTVMGGTDLSAMAQQVQDTLGASGTADRQPDLPIWTHPAFVDMFGRPFNLDTRVGGSSPDTLANAVNSGLSLLENFGLSSVPLQQGVAVLQASGATRLISKVAASAGDSRAGALAQSAFGASANQTKALVSAYVPGARGVTSGLGMLQSGLGFLQHAAGITPSPAAAITALKLALQFALELLEQALPEPTAAARRTAEALRGAMALCDEMPTHCNDAQQWLDFSARLAARVAALRSGASMLVPVGWSTGEKDGTSHVLLLALCRAEGGGFTVLVCNAGAGLQYHATKLHRESGAALLNLPCALRGVSAERLCDPHWWLLALRPLLFPAEGHGPAPLYEQLLPALNGKAVLVSATEADEADWMPPPAASTALGCGGLVMQGVDALLRGAGLPRTEAQRALLAMQQQALATAAKELDEATALSASDAALLRMACRQVAQLATAQLTDPAAGAAEAADAEALLGAIGETSSALQRAMARAEGELPALRLAPPPTATAPFPLGGWLCRDLQALDALAGEAKVPPIVRPVQLSLVPDSVADYMEASVAMRHAARLCTVISHQAERMHNPGALRATLLEHLFWRALPVPRPPHGPEGEACFWRASPMRAETQLEILRLLRLLSRHYAAAVLGLRQTVVSDAARVLTMSAIAAVADAVARRVASDVPSWFCLHYSGAAAGPGLPFGFEPCLAADSESMRVHDATLLALRTQLLDYFHAVGATIGGGGAGRQAHTVFGFEQSMTFGEADSELLGQLAWQVGYPDHGFPELVGKPEEAAAARTPQLWRYLTGESQELSDDYPELSALRDIVFTLKMLLAPHAEDLPPPAAYRVSDALLHWSSDKEGRLTVRGFGTQLKAAYAARAAPSGLLGRFSAFFGGASRPRTPLSAADPSGLAGVEVGVEDDVLHLTSAQLPSFSGRVSPADSEYLLQLLTVPYLRLPLLVAFFASQQRVTALAEPSLQAMLDAACFEPGLFQPDTPRPVPTQLPALSRDVFATPVGLLVNELQHAPTPLLASLLELGRHALELDAGHYRPSGGSLAVLYALRLLVRVQGHLMLVLDGTRHHGAAGNARGTEPRGGAHGQALEAANQELHELLWGRYFPLLERWLARALAVRNSSSACVLQAPLLTLTLTLAIALALTLTLTLTLSLSLTLSLTCSRPISRCSARTSRQTRSTTVRPRRCSSRRSTSPTSTRGTSTSRRAPPPPPPPPRRVAPASPNMSGWPTTSCSSHSPSCCRSLPRTATGCCVGSTATRATPTRSWRPSSASSRTRASAAARRPIRPRAAGGASTASAASCQRPSCPRRWRRRSARARSPSATATARGCGAAATRRSTPRSTSSSASSRSRAPA